jgi:hypothetical protein
MQVGWTTVESQLFHKFLSKLPFYQKATEKEAMFWIRENLTFGLSGSVIICYRYGFFLFFSTTILIN